MPQANKDSDRSADAADLAANWETIVERSQSVMTAFLERQSRNPATPSEDAHLFSAFMDMTAHMLSDPAKLARAQTDLWQNHLKLWQQATERMLGQGDAPEMAAPARDDRRFRDEAWQESAVFDFIKQSYLLTSKWMQRTVADVEGLDDKTAAKVEFYTQQFADAMAPTNFLISNPEALRATIDSGGENLVRGLDNLLRDLERGDGELKITMTDMDAFDVGTDVAATPGEVVYRNDMIELIQYAPTTEKVHKRPLLMVPPWINKFYILDLRPENSLVRWARDQGYTVFMISWVNPDERLAEKSFEDYLLEGPVAALDAIEQATGEREIVATSLCLGGTLLASTLGYLKAIGDERIKTATFMASLVDFSEPGELGVFIDEDQIETLEKRMEEKGGVLDAGAMSQTFNMLRANDLIWSFVVNNYLLGKDPFPFDLLYWNADSTRMPARMHSFYLRNMYQRNALKEPGGIELAGQPIDLGSVTTPVYILATKEDHIAPWRSCYAGTGVYGGSVKFVLGGSGHIAGVANSPNTAKYPYWTNTKKPKTADKWLDGADQHDGSWWTDWHAWQSRKAGPMVPARVPGDGKLSPLVPAPGTYVMEKAK